MKTWIEILNEKIISVPAKKLNIDVYRKSIVKKYVERIKNGETFTPSFVSKDDLSRVVDGNHRAAAYKELGMPVPVVKVDPADALTKMAKGMSAEEYYKAL